MATIREIATPAEMNNDWYDHYSGMADDIQRWHKDGIHLDAMGIGGDTDETKLTLAIAEQTSNNGSSLNYPPIILPNRPLSFTTPRALYSGCKIIGPHKTGQKNPELSGGVFVGPEIQLGGSISSGTSSWWNGTGDLYNVFMADFSVRGSSGSSVHQFMDVPNTGGTLYACTFHGLSFEYMRAVFGRKDRTMGMTQVLTGGEWTMQNLWDQQMHLGGSDNKFGWFLNAGTSQSPAQTGTYADQDYMFQFENLSNTEMGYIYLTALNGWRGVWIRGTNSSIVFMAGIFEGFKPTRVNGLLGGPAPGSVVRQDAGSTTWVGSHFGQFMDNPDAAETAGFILNGGSATLLGTVWFGANMDTVDAIDHNGGRLSVFGSHWRDGDAAHASRPRVATTAANDASDYAYSCPDFSMADV